MNIPIITPLCQRNWKLLGLSHSRASKICSSKRLLKNQIELIEQFMLWNDFPKYIRKSFLKNICKEAPKQEKNIANKNNIPTIWIRLTYIGNKGEHLLKQRFRKVKRNCTSDIKFLILYNTKKVSYYYAVKDKIPIAQRSSVVYQITCRGYLKRYVRKQIVVFIWEWMNMVENQINLCMDI